MAAFQSKSNNSSSSPLLNKLTNPRNSEIGNPMRRSFSGNPFAKPSVITNQKPGFNPNTPPNSSSDHSRRNSIGRESVAVSFRDSEDKENSKDLKSKLGSIRSPASLPGMKNFMSPTISAASKVNPSPRKKILTERNESVRTSVSMSNGNGPLKEHSEFKTEKGLNQKKGVSFNPTVTYMEEKEEEAEAWNNNEDLDSVVSSNHVLDDFDSFAVSLAAENDFVNLDPSFEISPRTSSSLPSPALAPLDADPVMPPYDIEKNYVSPRPRFLHYKPSPLVELYLKQRDEKQLEEIFAYESSSDTEITELETVCEESLVSHKDSEDSASGDITTEEEEENEEAELPVSEPDPITTNEGANEARKTVKRNFLIKPKFKAFLFLLALAGLWAASVCNSPMMDPTMLNNFNFPNLYLPPEIPKFTRENLEGLGEKSRQWLYDSLYYIHNLVISFKEWHNPGRLKFANLTVLLEDSSVNNYLLLDQSTFVAEMMNKKLGEDVKSFEQVEQGPNEEVEDDNEEVEESDETYEEVTGCKGEESIYQEAIVLPDNFEGLGVAIESEEESTAIQTDVATRPGNLATEKIQERVEIAEQSAAIVNAETEPELSSLHHPLAEDSISSVETLSTMTALNPESFELEAKIEPKSSLYQPLAGNAISPVETESTMTAFNLESFELEAKIEPKSSLHQPLADNAISPVETESTMTAFNPESFESDVTPTMEQQIQESVGLLSRQAIIAISLLTILSLIAVVPFIHTKNRASGAPNAAKTANQVAIAKKVSQSPLPTTTFQEEVDTIGESCPSETSSFYMSSSCGKQERSATSASDSAQSRETRKTRSNNRRESMASSDCSMGSASYGSFTTCEKVPIKLGKGEEGVITPVRRSSRIRKQVTSP